jgi:hypothetical protein
MTTQHAATARSRHLAAALAVSAFAWAGLAGTAHADAVADLGAAVSYKPLQPAEPQGVSGFDIGVATSHTQIDDGENVTVTRLNLHKGLPYGFDVGAFFGRAYRDGESSSLSGYELRYALVQGNTALPAVAVRGAYTRLGDDDLDLDTKSLDLTISKGFLFLTPYAGIGQVWMDSKLGDASMTKTYGGLNIALGLFAVNLEADQTGDVTTYGLKVALRW